MKQEKRSLGEWLVGQGIITQDALEKAHEEEKISGEPMRKVLIRMELVNEDDMVNFISQQMDIQRIDLSNYLIDSKIIDLVPEELARKHYHVAGIAVDVLTPGRVQRGNVNAVEDAIVVVVGVNRIAAQVTIGVHWGGQRVQWIRSR